ncbi:MAG: uracil-DNA glycosylase [Treponema sp.]|nr:uracil-DNA glycosylase [Treponema sp.]
MTSQEKADIYCLLKTASSAVLGFEDTSFSGEISFSDDPVMDENPQSATRAREGLSLDTLYEKIRSCRNCQLHATRTNAVPGEGVQNPLVMVIGEGPGEDEDKTGRPFVGKAGQLLDKMLAAISLDRNKNCYIANIVKCRPPNNRTPFPQEAESCSGYLQAQIHILKPKAILAMGRTAVQNLMKTDEGINALRGKILDLNGIPLLATYHPSALLRNVDLKRPAWNDLKVFREKLLALCPDYER